MPSAAERSRAFDLQEYHERLHLDEVELLNGQGRMVDPRALAQIIADELLAWDLGKPVKQPRIPSLDDIRRTHADYVRGLRSSGVQGPFAETPFPADVRSWVDWFQTLRVVGAAG